MKEEMRNIALPLLLLCAMTQAQAGKVTYVYTDPQGTPLAEADANGNVTATFDYRPYGSIAMGAAPDGPSYTGHVNDPDIGLVYMQARYYDPSVGRFMSRDRIPPKPGDIFSFGRFTYVDNNPMSRVDPTGDYSCDTKNQAANCSTVKKGLEKVANAAKSYSSKSPEGKQLNAILKFYGKENDGNNVSVVFGRVDGVSNGQTTYDANAGVLVKFDTTAMSKNFGGLGKNAASVEYAGTIAHEGQHGVDAMASRSNPRTSDEAYNTEFQAFKSQSYINRSFGTNSPYGVWDTSWPSNLANGFMEWNADLNAQCAAYKACSP